MKIQSVAEDVTVDVISNDKVTMLKVVHPQSILTNLSDLTSDVDILTSDDKVIRSHSHLLAGVSPKLRGYILSNPKCSYTINFRRFSWDVLQPIIKFASDGVLFINTAEMREVCDCAAFLEIDIIVRTLREIQNDENTCKKEAGDGKLRQKRRSVEDNSPEEPQEKNPRLTPSKDTDDTPG